MLSRQFTEPGQHFAHADIRMQAEIEPSAAKIRHDVQVAASLQHTEVEARPTQDRVAAGREFRREFVATAKGIEGSGWAVLGLKKGMRGKRLEIAPVHNHENRALWQFQVLLPMDVWEHAYYLDHQNDREGWANTFLDHLVDWEYVGTRL